MEYKKVLLEWGIKEYKHKKNYNKLVSLVGPQEASYITNKLEKRVKEILNRDNLDTDSSIYLSSIETNRISNPPGLLVKVRGRVKVTDGRTIKVGFDMFYKD